VLDSYELARGCLRRADAWRLLAVHAHEQRNTIEYAIYSGVAIALSEIAIELDPTIGEREPEDQA
jgi:hypothetical protein